MNMLLTHKWFLNTHVPILKYIHPPVGEYMYTPTYYLNVIKLTSYLVV